MNNVFRLVKRHDLRAGLNLLLSSVNNVIVS